MVDLSGSLSVNFQNSADFWDESPREATSLNTNFGPKKALECYSAWWWLEPINGWILWFMVDITWYNELVNEWYGFRKSKYWHVDMDHYGSMINDDQSISQVKTILVGGLEHEFYDFPYIGNNNPNWLSYFFRGVETTNQYSSVMLSCFIVNTYEYG